MNSGSVFSEAKSIDDLIVIISSAIKPRAVAAFGVKKVEGVSLQKTRRTANDSAVKLLNSLPDTTNGNDLTDEQRSVLAAYTGEGGLQGEGGSQYEYYTPQFMAEGIWDLMSAYGAGAGHVLEPSAGTGIFQEVKPKSAVMTSAELSPISGRINQLLHPEDSVTVGAFESLAAGTPDGVYDHAVGNVPFGKGRSGVAGLDPVYESENNVGDYFVLRTIDKVKPGGMVVLVVPHGMTDGANNKKLRDKVSRKAEFLGAHRMPSGTFAESGTATVVDVWVLRKHSDALKAIVDESADKVLKSANVLWPEFLNGQWFRQDGKKFVHGEMERTDYQNMLVVKKDDQITNSAMKAALSRKFDSRIDYDLLTVQQNTFQGAEPGDKRLVGGIWHEFDGEKWVKKVTVDSSSIDSAQFGASDYAELRGRTSSISGLLSFNSTQLSAIAQSYPALLGDQHKAVLQFALSQRPQLRERVLRGGLVGLRIIEGMDAEAKGMGGSDVFADAAAMAATEFTRFGRSDALKLAGLNNPQARAWLAFQGNVSSDGTVSAMLSGTLVTGNTIGINLSDPTQVVGHLFSQISLMPVTLDDFRSTFTGDLPADDDAALSFLASVEGIALDGNGNLQPMTRATSGNVRGRVTTLLAMADNTPDGAIKDNYLRQIDGINALRGHIPLNKIKINLNARWMDRRLIQEFLADQGYDQFKYTSPDLEIEDGELMSPDGYAGKDGVFTGYQMRSVVSPKTGEKEFKKATNSDGFLNQLENYLNGVRPRGQNASEYLEKIAALEDSFNQWIASHASADQVENDYNDAFNGYIPFTHSDATLNLQGISGKRVPLSYQNEEVRRLSEDGRGVMGFGTGLGKTTTGLALEAYNFETGRTKRTATVVPKAVYQNWYHEAQEFYSADAFNSMLFVGLDVVMGDDGKPLTAPVKNDSGEVVKDSAGNPVVRTVVKESSTADVLLRLNQIPTSNWRNVILTKEQYAMIPLRQETIEANQQQALFDAVESGRVNIGKSTHREASKINRLKDKAADTGTAKKQNVPYFEDMNFDSVIADEGHNYRNSFSAGREAGQLAYLPNSAVSQMARDMAVKSAYMMKKNNGRGVVMLTATPLVNSPIDAFNMLSHVMPVSEWQAMGIYTPDDFVRVFGETETVSVQTISGAIEQKQGLVGFKNLDGLRGIFHRWASIKVASDVKASVKIPDIIESTTDVPITEEQANAYEALRQRATLLSSGETVTGESQQGSKKPDDAIFSIIRDMDKVTLDPDLYKNQIRFQFQEKDSAAVNAIVADLPLSAGGEQEGEDESQESNPLKQPKEVTTTLTTKGNILELTVSISLENQVLKAIASKGIDLSTVSHPVPPKYTALIENLRAGLQDGKQIIFIDEKTQHGKLQRIISQALGMELNQIGIINATTVAAAGGVKVKPVKQPVEPKEGKDGFKPGAWDKYYADKSRYEDYIAATNDVSLAGMEGIAADYNEGRTPIVICNKKAEVGINLHKGTSDIHHLTFPWTPASINQRNGRGARVGSSQESVRAHYYCGKGTFDDFRLETLQRKKDWLNTIMTSNESEMVNGDAASTEERSVMLAANPEERRAMLAQQKAAREAEKQRVAKQNAEAALDTFLKASNAASRPIEQLQAEQKKAQAVYDNAKKTLATARDEQASADAAVVANSDSSSNYMSSYYKKIRADARREFRAANESMTEATDALKKANNAVKRATTAGTAIKRSLGDINRAIESGVLNIDPDVLKNPAEYTRLDNGSLVRIGQYFEISTESRGDCIAQLTDISPEKGTGEVKVISEQSRSYGAWKAGQVYTTALSNLSAPVAISESDASLLLVASTGVRIPDITSTFTADKFAELTSGNGITLITSGTVYSAYSTNSGNKWLVDQDGAIDMVTLPGMTLKGNGLLYPDGNNEQLKSRIAEWYLKSSSTYGLSNMLTAVYGSNYSTVLESYGEQATIKDVEAAFDAAVAGLEKKYPEYGDFYQNDLAQAVNYFLNGDQVLNNWTYSLTSRGITALIEGDFSNTTAIRTMIETTRDARIGAKREALQAGRTDYIGTVVKAINSVSEQQIRGSLADMVNIEPVRMLSDAKIKRDVIRSDVPLYIGTGLFLKAISSDSVSQAKAWTDFTGMALTVGLFMERLAQGGYTKSGLVDGESNMTFEQWLSAVSGTMTDDERKAIQNAADEAKEQAATEAAQVVESTQADGYTVTVNDADMIATVKSKFRGRFYTRSLDVKAGQGLILVDTGSTPVLKQKAVRELLKSTYQAIFWDFSVNPVAGCNANTPAWIIPTKTDAATVQAAISKVAE